MLRTRKLRRLLARPQRVVIALCVAVCALFVLSVGWLQVAKVARKKVQEQIAKVQKKLGVPIEIGRWTLSPLGAHFEDVRLGPDAAVVISRMTAEVGLNPFADTFGELAAVTVNRVRVKSSLSRVQGQVQSLRESALLDGPRGAATQKTIEKLFAALPTAQLRLESAGVDLIGDDGKPVVTVKGLALLVDRKARKVLFKVASLRQAGGPTESNLQGRFELNPKGSDYRFFVRRKVKADAKANAWAVSGQLAKDLGEVKLDVDAKRVPTFAQDLLADYLGKKPRVDLRAQVKAARADDAWKFDARVTSLGTRIEMPLLSSKPVGPVRFDMIAKGFWRGDDRVLALESATVSVPNRRTGKYGKAPVRITLNGAGRLPEPGGEGGYSLQAQVQLKETSCQALLDASPPGLLPTLVDFKLDGQAGVGATLVFDSAKPESSTFELHDGKYGCRVLQAPYTYSQEHLAGPFTLQREVGKDDEPLEIAVSPLAPTFTPLEQVAKNVNLAFIASEDAGFLQHKGIDGFALESALKRNLLEGRVAVGGSTITMQTVKNLFLTPERTISRKMQELFLAWHLENVLTKERILEIYVNIVELGPGIYGVTQAAEHYFAKHPFELNLLESAYLASLLPAPKTRYRYFCEGKLTPNFSGMVHGLLKRMLGLGRIPYDRYAQTVGKEPQFNEQARATSTECTRKSPPPAEGEEGP